MMKFTKFAAGAAAPVLALSLLAGSANAQSYRDRDHREDNTAKNALVGAAIGGIAGALIGNGDGRYVAGGALAGAAVGAAASSNSRYDDRNYRGGYGYSRGPDCEYFRDGRCWRNEGHWEREHGINSRDYDRGRYDRRDYRYDRRW